MNRAFWRENRQKNKENVRQKRLVQKDPAVGFLADLTIGNLQVVILKRLVLVFFVEYFIAIDFLRLHKRDIRQIFCLTNLIALKMHFFYTDESGDTGRNLRDPDQPIMVLGGVNLRDQGWNRSQKEMRAILEGFLGRPLSADFELHAYELLSPNGIGVFEGYEIEDRANLAKDLLELIISRSHGTHLVAFDKEKIRTTDCGLTLAFDLSRPYLLGFDYLVTCINAYVRNRLGRSARGLLVLDEKQEHHDDIATILHNRRYEGAATHRVKWIVDVGYSVESHRNPMIQLSDLVVFCARRFLEIEHGYREEWPSEAKRFYAECYGLIDQRLISKNVVPRQGRGFARLNEYIQGTRCAPIGRWRNRWGIDS